MLAPWAALLTRAHVAWGLYSSITVAPYERACEASLFALVMYPAVALPTGPTTMTTLMVGVAAAAGRAAAPVVAKTAAIARLTSSRRVRWPDALWAPSWWTGNALASSLPEHRA